MDKLHKKVYFPIVVPNNDYCWDGRTPCQFFDNTGGHGTCALNIGFPDLDKEGYYPKPNFCKKLNGNKKNT